MPLQVEHMVSSTELRERYVFLSGSIPDPERWKGKYEAFEITDAVVAAVRAIFTASGRLVCAVHPTIAPLLLNVAGDFPIEGRKTPLILIYQSRLFQEEIVAETRQLELRPELGEIRWTERASDPDPVSRREKSLATMRQAMLAQNDPAGAIFIGGMEGVTSEFRLFRELYPSRPVYPLGKPGGAAAELVPQIDSSLSKELASSEVYPVLLRAVIDDLAKRLEPFERY